MQNFCSFIELYFKKRNYQNEKVIVLNAFVNCLISFEFKSLKTRILVKLMKISKGVAGIKKALDL